LDLPETIIVVDPGVSLSLVRKVFPSSSCLDALVSASLVIVASFLSSRSASAVRAACAA